MEYSRRTYGQEAAHLEKKVDLKSDTGQFDTDCVCCVLPVILHNLF